MILVVFKFYQTHGVKYKTVQKVLVQQVSECCLGLNWSFTSIYSDVSESSNDATSKIPICISMPSHPDSQIFFLNLWIP